MSLTTSGRSLEERLSEHKQATHQLQEEVRVLMNESLDGSDVSEKMGILQLRETALHETGEALRKDMSEFFHLANLSLKTAQAEALDRVLPSVSTEDTTTPRKPRM